MGSREGGERGSLILFFNSGAYIVERLYGRTKESHANRIFSITQTQVADMLPVP